MSTNDLCFYFGCWNAPGHYLFAPDGIMGALNYRRLEHYWDHVHLDGTLAPRRNRRTGAVTWQGNARTRDERNRIGFDSEEYPQGQFLRHELDTGYTAIQWWDRTQGDTRGGCNSTILLKGKHTSEEMLAALKQHFPTVLAHLTASGVTLSEVVPGGATDGHG